MVTMKEIAQKAGVSRTTVSFVLNGRCHQDQRVSRPVEEKVLAAARELGYVRNDLVLSLVKGRSRTIGIVSSFRDFIFPILQGYAQEAQEHGYSLRLFPVEDDLSAALTKAVESRVDAVAGIGLSSEAGEVSDRFLQSGIPMTGFRNSPHTVPLFDQQKAAAEMTEFLVHCGYRKILCYGGNYPQMPLREAGYREIMEKHHLSPVCRNHHDVSADEIIDEKPEAVFCGDDYMACMLLQAAYRRKINVPGVFGVTGFGGTQVSRFSSPPLTTVEEPFFESGIAGAKRLISLIETGKTPETTPLPGKIIVRESTVCKESCWIVSKVI